MSIPMGDIFRHELLSRRERLASVGAAAGEAAQLNQLLQEVDAALERMDGSGYGLCEVCHEPIEAERLIANPLARFCLDHLTCLEQRALEQDLELATTIQRGLLPPRELHYGDWRTSYHYEAAGLVSGDYCDLVSADGGILYFMLGDVSGKGIAASMLMSHIHAMLRALISVGLPLDQLVARASRMFCESTLPTHFATLVCGKTGTQGEVEICNAGHPPPLWLAGASVTSVEATGLPIGMFCNEEFVVKRLQLEKGDTLLLYTDGLVETENPSGVDYGAERLCSLVSGLANLPASRLLSTCLQDLTAFRAGARKKDDLTLLAVQRA